MTTIYMYYETDGDSGYYNIKLFRTQEVAEAYHRRTKNAYGNVTPIDIHDKDVSFKYDEFLCPDCNGPMVSRKGQYGTFWGCKAYPSCRGTRDSNGLSKAERASKRSQNENDSIADVAKSIEWPRNEQDKITFKKN